MPEFAGKNIDDVKEIENNKETFIATLTHDLKTPTFAQINMSKLLLNEHFGKLTKERLDECNLKHLEPQKYFGEYNKLIFCEYDGSGSGKNTPKVQE